MFRVVFVMDIFNRSVVLAKGGSQGKVPSGFGFKYYM